MRCPNSRLTHHNSNDATRHLTNDECAQLTGEAASFASEAELCDTCHIVFVRQRQLRQLGWFDHPTGHGFMERTPNRCAGALPA
jgi:hypothetical protein